MARTFGLALTTLMPAAFVLMVAAIRDRAAVLGSFGARIGIVPASLALTAGGRALIVGTALVLGSAARRTARAEYGAPAVKPARVPLETALAVAGLAALVLALTLVRRKRPLAACRASFWMQELTVFTAVEAGLQARVRRSCGAEARPPRERRV